MQMKQISEGENSMQQCVEKHVFKLSCNVQYFTTKQKDDYLTSKLNLAFGFIRMIISLFCTLGLGYFMFNFNVHVSFLSGTFMSLFLYIFLSTCKALLFTFFS